MALDWAPCIISQTFFKRVDGNINKFCNNIPIKKLLSVSELFKIIFQATGGGHTFTTTVSFDKL